MTFFRAPFLLRWLTPLLLSGAALHAVNVRAQTLSIGLIADRPQSELESQWLPEYLRAIGGDLDLLLHAGGIRHPDEACHDALYLNRHERFEQSPAPLLYTPAALDWALCDTVRAHPYQKTERLTFLRQVFFGTERSLGKAPLPVMRQSQSKRFRLYVENQRLQLKNAVVLTLNLPENDNNFSFAAGRNGEFEERDQANRYWLEAGFRFAQANKADWLLIVASADLDFERVMEDPRNPYHPLLSVLAQQLGRHALKVLWISRGMRQHDRLVDQPRPEAHFWRVRSQDSLDPGVWTRIQLTPAGPRASSQYTPLR
ncbi:MAG: hypothetical protein WCY07_05365 [Pigmentiphaga sp.]